MNSTKEAPPTAQDIDRIGESLGHDMRKLGGQDFYTLWRYWKLAVERLNKHSYEGTVPAKTIAQRRAKNRMAKASRKVNRR